MFFLIALVLSMVTVIVRAVFVDNSIYLAIPTATYILVWMMLFIYPYREEIALFDADASLITILNRADAVKFEKVEKANNLYKISANWLTLDQEEAIKYLRNSEERQR